MVALEVLIVLALIGVNGVLAMSEMAIVSARRARLEQRAAAGDRGARAALELAAEPNRFLSTVQIGITLVGILAGAFGGATLARSLAGPLSQVPALAAYAEHLAVGIVVLAITYLSLVIGELVPKRLGLRHAEFLAALVAPPMQVVSRLAAPLVAVLSGSTDAVLRLLGVRPTDEPTVTEEEIKLLIEQGTRAGVLESGEQVLLNRAFGLADRRVAEVMQPRPRIVWLDSTRPLAEQWHRAAASPHSRFPVGNGSLDDVLGIVYIKDWWARLVQGERVDLRALLRQPLYVPESMSALHLLERFQQTGVHFALVLDEYGSTAGIATLTDVLEAIVGDLPASDEPADSPAVRRPDGSWLLDGLLPIPELKLTLQLDDLPDEEEYDTLAGFLLYRLGRLPRVGDATDWQGWRFEVVDMDGHRVDRVLATPAPAESAAPR